MSSMGPMWSAMTGITIHPQHALKGSELLQSVSGQSAFGRLQLFRQCSRNIVGHAGLHQSVCLSQAIPGTNHDHPMSVPFLQQRTPTAFALQPTRQCPVALYNHRRDLQRRLGLVKLLLHDMHDGLHVFCRTDLG